MQKGFKSFTLVCLLAMSSCINEIKNMPPLDKSSVTDSVIIEKTEALDPGSSDSIPAGNYDINSSNAKTADLVRLTLQGLYKEDLSKNFIDGSSKKFIFFEYDLNDDAKKEIFVGLTGSYFCGSGGCTQLILDNQGHVISTFTVSGYPVIIDNNKTNGWKDLFIYSGSKNRIVKFDGKTYPPNPSVLPELRITPGDELTRALNFINEPYTWHEL